MALGPTAGYVLDMMPVIKIEIAYEFDDEVLSSYSADLGVLIRAEVIYHKISR